MSTTAPNPRSLTAVAATVGTLSVAALALSLAAGGAAAGPAVVAPATPLSDLGTGAAEGLAGARAGLTLTDHAGHDGRAATAVLRVTGIDRTQSGRTYGAHLHTGPCVAGDGAAAGGHYNDDVENHHAPVVVSSTTEVWLDLTVTAAGSATTVAHVPFAPTGGLRSVVVHALPTDAAGAAGTRLACLPVTW